MKILLVHNFYGSSAPSGENKVFEAEKAMLERHGHEVMVYARHSDEIRVVSGQWLVVKVKKAWGMAKGALCTIGNPVDGVRRVCGVAHIAVHSLRIALCAVRRAAKGYSCFDRTSWNHGVQKSNTAGPSSSRSSSVTSRTTCLPPSVTGTKFHI